MISISKITDVIREYPHTQIILAGIGSIALLLFVAALFITWGGNQKELVLTNPVTVGTPEFLETLSRLISTSVEVSSPVKILNNGDEFFPELISSINNAKKSINFTTYIWKKGTISKEVLEALTNAAKRGVEVRIIEDGFAGKAPKDDIEALETAGGRVEKFHTFFGAQIAHFHKRTHRRAIIIDGNVGFMGGMAISDVWLGDGKSKDEWRDMMFELHGNMAKSLQSAFADMWTEITGEVLSGDKFYPSASLPTPQKTTKTPVYLNLVSTPSPETEPVRDFFYLSVLGSTKTLYITNPYLLPDPALLKAIEDKAKSGVDVKILLPRINDSRIVRWASQKNYEALLDAGVKIYEYQPTMIHLKTLVVDGVWSIIGSANMDSRSRILNNENLMGIQDSELATSLNNNFEENLKLSEEITLENGGKQNIFQKVRSKLSALFAKQY